MFAEGGVVEGSLGEGLKFRWEEGIASYTKLGWEVCRSG